ncbi:MAG: hypothetical protein ACR2MD_13410 [Aridibacter sp.]
MATETIEGTWEEIAQHASDFVGRKVRLTILDEEESPKQNEIMLEALRKVSERSKDVPMSANDETLKLIREARSGGMFGDDTDN